MTPHTIVGLVAITAWMAATYLLVDVAHRQVMVLTSPNAVQYSPGTVIDLKRPRGRLWVRVLETSGNQMAVVPCSLLLSAWLELGTRLTRATRRGRMLA